MTIGRIWDFCPMATLVVGLGESWGRWFEYSRIVALAHILSRGLMGFHCGFTASMSLICVPKVELPR
jgi:hypothetical protein